MQNIITMYVYVNIMIIDVTNKLMNDNVTSKIPYKVVTLLFLMPRLSSSVGFVETPKLGQMVC